MQRLLFAVLLVLALAGRAFAEPPALSGRRILVLGDSITQDGRYVSYLEYYLHTAGQDCDLISIGLSSETVSGLSEAGHPFPRPCVLERLDRALKAVKPAVVVACYGMNDGIYHPPAPERLAAFTDGLRQLIAQVRNAGAQLVLITPPIYDPLPAAAKTVPATAEKFGFTAPYVGYDDELAEFSRAEMALKADGVTVIDLHTAMAQALAARRTREPAFSFTKDGIHPQDAGHLFMAHTIAAGLGLPTPADLDAELARLSAEPIFALIRVRRELRSEAWLPFVGYTRGTAYKSASIAAAEKAAERLHLLIDAPAEK